MSTSAPHPSKLLLLWATLSLQTLHCFGAADEALCLGGPKESVAGSRRARSVSTLPQPRDCVLSAWSSWSSCDPCQKKRYRFALLEQPSQFGGDACEYSDRESEGCATSSPCRSKVRCDGFVCALTGRCITRRLLCNGDDDCGDLSDERNCNKVSKKCDQKWEQYWGIENLAKGLNVFTSDLEGLVLDHRYYAGGCSPHYIMDTRFRKPHNVESYTPETKGKYEFTLAEYDSYSSYESSVLREKSKEFSIAFGIKIPTVFEAGFSYKDNRLKKFIQRMKRFSSTASKFVHARSELAVATYRLKPRALVLHHEFLQRLRQLPLEYSYGEYRELYRDYGTHYITEATVGGVYEYTLVMNSDELQKAGYSLSDVQKCAQGSAKIGGNIEGVYAVLGVSASDCKTLLKEVGDATAKKQFVEDFIALVRGGASEHITTLAYRDLPTATLMQQWGDAVQYNPEIIKMKEASVSAYVPWATVALLVRSPRGKMMLWMETGVAGPAGLRVQEAKEQGGGSATTLPHRMVAHPAQGQMLRLLLARGSP
ncbi:complement component C8 beta chain isoform X2 [Pogoniulus pusillus]|uniref:complement component C8 beta chain isoform X2 n=1 Tax=Pogoniulus pusillus TaxID=488313 RepID=UPI0030B99055